MTKKDLTLIAECIREIEDKEVRGLVARKLAQRFSELNERFSPVLFYKACGVLQWENA